MFLSEEFSEGDALTNYAECVDSPSSQMQEKEEDSRPSQKRNQCDLTDAIGDSVNTVPSACATKKRKGKGITLNDKHLDLQCEWQGCDYRTCNLDHFLCHVSFHIPQLEAQVNEDNEGTGSVVFPRTILMPCST